MNFKSIEKKYGSFRMTGVLFQSNFFHLTIFLQAEVGMYHLYLSKKKEKKLYIIFGKIIS